MWTIEISDLRPQTVHCPECRRGFMSVGLPLVLKKELKDEEGETTGWLGVCPFHGEGTVFND